MAKAAYLEGRHDNRYIRFGEGIKGWDASVTKKELEDG